MFASFDGLSGFVGTGTPISPYHVLTASHVIDTNADGASNYLASQITFRMNYGGSPSHVIGVSSFTIHPDFDGFNNPIGVVNDDLVILTLSSPLPMGVPVYPLHTSALTAGETLIFAGYGITGDGVTGYTGGPSLTVKRTGKNEITLADVDDEGSGDLEVFGFDFDGPTVATDFDGSFPGLGNTVETNFGGGDSGGPAFIDVGGGMLELVGVNTFTFQFAGVGTPLAPFFGSGGGGCSSSPTFLGSPALPRCRRPVRCCQLEPGAGFRSCLLDAVAASQRLRNK